MGVYGYVERLAGAFHEVTASAAMYVQIDATGHDIRAVYIDAFRTFNTQLGILDTKNLSAFHNYAAAIQPPLGSKNTASDDLFVPFAHSVTGCR